MDAEDFETIPSSAEELSISSDGEDESHNKNVCLLNYNFSKWTLVGENVWHL